MFPEARVLICGRITLTFHDLIRCLVGGSQVGMEGKQPSKDVESHEQEQEQANQCHHWQGVKSACFLHLAMLSRPCIMCSGRHRFRLTWMPAGSGRHRERDMISRGIGIGRNGYHVYAAQHAVTGKDDGPQHEKCLDQIEAPESQVVAITNGGAEQPAEMVEFVDTLTCIPLETVSP